MKCFLLIVLVPSILMSQDFKREIDSLFETKKYDQAIEKMEVYLDNTPQELDLLELMGDAYGFKSEWSKAAVYYEKLMTIDEANANYNYKYGGVLGKLAKEGSKLKALSLIPKVKSAFLNEIPVIPPILPEIALLTMLPLVAKLTSVLSI